MKSGKSIKVISAAVLALIAISILYAAASHYHNSIMNISGQTFHAGSDGSVTFMNHSYGDRSCEYFDMFIPENVDRHHAPLILFVHGGGWEYGDCSDFLPECRKYADMGFITATINYSLLSSDTPEVTFDFMMDEFVQCLNEINCVCAEEGVDISGMATYGYSAGGHLALLYAYSRSDISPIPVKCAFALAPPASFDLSSWEASTYWPSTDAIADIISLASGRQVDKDKILYNPYIAEDFSSLSPLTFIDETTVPTVLGHGSVDFTVPPIHSEILSEKLKIYGIPFSYIVFQNSTHMLENDTGASAEWENTVKNYAEKYLVKDVGQIE